jgi:NADPH-dependent ferric siderophore reductase
MHYLLVGDSADLGTLRRMADSLPADAYGQVYIEVASKVQVEQFRTRAGLTVTWLRRDRDAHRTGTLAPRGLLAARAMAGWASEWLGDDAGELRYAAWIGCASSSDVRRLLPELANRPEMHLHAASVD